MGVCWDVCLVLQQEGGWQQAGRRDMQNRCVKRCECVGVRTLHGITAAQHCSAHAACLGAHSLHPPAAHIRVVVADNAQPWLALLVRAAHDAAAARGVDIYTRAHMAVACVRARVGKPSNGSTRRQQQFARGCCAPQRHSIAATQRRSNTQQLTAGGDHSSAHPGLTLARVPQGRSC